MSMQGLFFGHEWRLEHMDLELIEVLDAHQHLTGLVVGIQDKQLPLKWACYFHWFMYCFLSKNILSLRMLLLGAHHLGWLKSPKKLSAQCGTVERLIEKRKGKLKTTEFWPKKGDFGQCGKRNLELEKPALSPSLIHTMHPLGWPVPSQTSLLIFPASLSSSVTHE